MKLSEAKEIQRNLDARVRELNKYIQDNANIGIDVMLTVNRVEGVCVSYPILTVTVSVDPTEIE